MIKKINNTSIPSESSEFFRCELIFGILSRVKDLAVRTSLWSNKLTLFQLNIEKNRKHNDEKKYQQNIV